MRLAIISSTVMYLAVTANLVAADDRDQSGEVFGEPVYRDQIRSNGQAVRDDLHRLFTSPVLDRYKQERGRLERERNKLDRELDESIGRFSQW
jgi:hypothetical protein